MPRSEAIAAVNAFALELPFYNDETMTATKGVTLNHTCPRLAEDVKLKGRFSHDQERR